MIILHDFGIGLEEYEERGKQNKFPVFDRCPDCHCISQGNIHRNGYYWRYGIGDAERAVHIPICRFKCLACGVNISILPDFLIPYYQHTLHTIVERIHLFLKGKKSIGSRQQLAQHIKRFYEILKWVHSYFMDLGHASGLTQDRKKEAQKYIEMIQDIGVSPFFRRSWGHLSTYFMGKLILPYLSPEKNKSLPT